MANSQKHGNYLVTLIVSIFGGFMVSAVFYVALAGSDAQGASLMSGTPAILLSTTLFAAMTLFLFCMISLIDLADAILKQLRENASQDEEAS